LALLHITFPEGYLLASGLFTDYRIGPICGVRIGLAVLFWATGISLMALNFAAKKRRRTLVVLTLVLGLASLIGAIILTTTSFQDSGLDFLRFLTSDNTYHG
jgi:zinc transporter ZupT